ncbi:MAG: PKD domain-containing protein [Bacteroidota bacterium]
MSITLRLLLVAVFGLSCLGAASQITVDFTADQTEGCGSLQVNFCDNSSSTAGNIVAWSWNLGGITSTSECQGRIFGSPGGYEICLTVTDSDGNTETLCKPDFVIINPLPQPDFIATPNKGCIPLTVAYDYTGSPNITEYIWGLNGTAGVVVSSGGSSPDAMSVYNLADEYDVSLTVTDDKGCSNSIQKNSFIETFEPTDVEVHADENFKCEPPFSVNFQNDNVQTNMTYFWDLGNGSTYIGVSPPPVLYTQKGKYTVTIIGENADTDCRDTLILADYITIGRTTEFSFTPDSGCENLSVTFSDDSPESTADKIWDFGDGSTPSAANSPTHIYEEPGIYTVTLTRSVQGCATFAVSTTEVEVFGLPDVNYSNDNSIGCELPHEVNFTGISNTAVSWYWDFGDGNTSTQQNPTHAYNNFGNFDVSLTVVDDKGCESKIDTISIQIEKTKAKVIQSNFSGCTPLTVGPVDNSSSIVPITNWLWEITAPSGTLTSTDQVPSFSVVDTGCFDLVLTVTNQLGCVDTRVFSEAICVGADPLVNFDASPVVACVQEVIQFNDLSSPYVDEWSWQFGDGSQSLEQHPTKSFKDTGSYSITLMASDNGCTDVLTIDDYIQVNAPKSIFNVVQDCSDKFSISVNNNSIGADSFYWDFGVVNLDTDTSTLEFPTFTYPDTGTYTVKLTTFNFATGCQHERKRVIYIHDPISSFQVSETRGCVPMTITAIDNSIHAAEYSWSGAGINFSGTNADQPSLTFNNPGIYTDIKLKVTDVNGCVHTSIFTDTIWVNDIEVSFTPDKVGGCQPFEVTFTETATNLFANNIQWNWTFENSATATGQTVTHTFADVGIHPVRLRVIDDWGCSYFRKIQDAVEVTNPTAAFTMDTLSCTTYPISFNNNSAGNSLTHFWDFGDGNTSTEKNPTHNYITEGIYTPCLTVTDEYGCTNTTCLTDQVVISNPIASFTPDTSFATCPPLIVNFENQSLHSSSYQWNFGDGGGLSDAENPSHIYTIPGVYDVQLIANSTAFCSDTLNSQGLIVLDGPLGNFTFDIDTSCAPMAVTFYAESQGNFTYVWDYDDGSPLDTILNVSTDTTVHIYTSEGTYRPKLAIIDPAGCLRILESEDSFFVPELSLDFQATENILCDVNNPVTFFNLLNSTGPVSSLQWAFEGGDPAVSTSFDPTVTFDGPGKYDVTLIAENAYCTDTLTKYDFIRIGAVPEAAFMVSDNAGCEPLQVQFTDMSTVDNGVIQNRHWKFGDGYETFLEAPSHTYIGGSSYEATLIVTSDVGCQDSVSQTINVTARPEVELTGDQNICIGEFTDLSAIFISDPTGVNYYWENSPSLSCTDCLNPRANPTDTTTYTFVAVNAEGCETTVTIQVDVRPEYAPVITVSNDTTMCVNDVIQLFVDGGTDVFSYTWDDSQAGLTCYDNCLNPIASPEMSTTYTVTVTNNAGCSSVDSVAVEVIDQNQSFLGEDRSICAGDTAQLHINTGSNPLWIISDGLNCSNCFDPVASPFVTTDFVAQVTTDEGCEIRDTVRINILTEQNIYAGDDQTICRGETTILYGQYFAPTSLNPVFAWSPAATLDDAASQNPLATPTETTTYNFTITTGDCVLRDSITVEVISKTEIEAVDEFVCAGDTAFLEVTGLADSYEWLPAEGLSDPTISNPIAFPTESGSFTVIAQLATCEPDTVEVMMNYIELPALYLSPEYVKFEDEPLLLEIEGNANSDYTYQWFPADGLSCTDCPNPTVNTNENTTYSVTVRDLFTGCQRVLTTKVTLFDYCSADMIGVPNVFTPDDDGNNDDLVINYSNALIIENYALQIFDRWGGMVYESKDINDRWDGRSDGKKVPSGVYIYYMSFPCHLTGATIRKTGDITIYR